MGETYTLHFDGGSRGNPGPAGLGVVLSAEDGTPVVTLGRFIGRATNNVAEYRAVITGLAEAKKLGIGRLRIRGDSELIIKQLRGDYAVRHPDLKPLHREAQELIAQLGQVTLEHTRRGGNALADKLANLAMDRRADVTDVDDIDLSPVAAPPSPHASGSAPRTPAMALEHACPQCRCVVRVVRPPACEVDASASMICLCGAVMTPQCD